MWRDGAPIRRASSSPVRMVSAFRRRLPRDCQNALCVRKIFSSACEFGLLAEPPICDRMGGVNAAIAEKRAIAPRIFALRGIAFDDENFLSVVRSLSDQLAKRISNKRIAPEFQPRIAARRLTLVPDAIHHGDINSVRDGMRALDCLPCIELRCAEFRLL